MAGIPSEFCACHDEQLILGSENVFSKDEITKIVDKINSYHEAYRGKCASYVFEKFLRVYQRISSGFFEYQEFLIQVYLNPGMALFETVVRRYTKTNRFEVLDEISRINRYGQHSYCIDHKIVANYCYCK